MFYYIIDANIYESISVFLFSYFLFTFIDSIGYDYNVNMITILFGIFQLLIMPMIVYRIYNNDSDAIALFYNMSVEEETYYSFVVPGLLLMICGMQIPLIRSSTKKSFFNNSILECKKYLKGKSNIGIVMMIIGLSTGIIEPFIASELSYIAYLLSKLLFIGIFYILFSEIKNKKIYIIAGLAALVIQTIIQGMFGELIYTSMLAFLLLLVGKKVDFYKKFLFCFFGAFLVLVLQSIKREYRAAAWHGVKSENTSNTTTFINLLYKRISNPGEIFDEANFFPIAVRFNQGMIQSKVMDYIPKFNPYTEGKTIFNSVIASFIPRFLWPDKPIAGGKWNMEYFTGLIIEGYSMNVGPLGEAYGNFGNQGGVYFMLFYGLFFNLVIYVLIRIAKTKPTIILWFPILFLNSIQMETDILMTVNSLLKNCIFVAVCYWATDRFMRIQL
jgi:hypothetical protein